MFLRLSACFKISTAKLLFPVITKFIFLNLKIPDNF